MRTTSELVSVCICSDWEQPYFLPLLSLQILGADYITSPSVTLSCLYIEITLLVSLQMEIVMNYFN